ncbi:preprotein translocase subunit TatA [Leekyejoonella antrihumi]|uniref:Preprotein translocase subunit TatA n=1 Tax=Leekyejoonella antrihumi TaxID=1660198 RepID=A0A563DUZ4_9MICO|nr:preprotein translocase subunit TatA [Leekyejoonella antrihumi]TWP33732.1 preprotein translocase subunit TatA [Leekyejoonella antrihumi]
MSFFGIDTPEFLILIVLAAVLIGPERLPEYLAKVRTWVRQARDMAESAQSQLKDQMGPEFDDVDWRQYDPRQYDPRKIIKDALFDNEADDPDAPAAIEAPSAPMPGAARFDPDRVTPYDVDAT